MSTIETLEKGVKCVQSHQQRQQNVILVSLLLTLNIFHTIQGLFQKTRACVRYNQKRPGKSSKKAQLWIFTPHFFKLRAFGTLHPSKRHMFLEFLVKKKVFYFSKRALSLRAGTARNKWLKKALPFSSVAIVHYEQMFVCWGVLNCVNIITQSIKMSRCLI